MYAAWLFRTKTRLHRGASPCTLLAHHAYYTQFSKLAIPLKIKLHSSIQKGDAIRQFRLRVMWRKYVKLGLEGGMVNV
jgi:hypothetical protein